jgi:hypothetical protein
MILLVTPSERGKSCAQVLQAATGHPTHVANTLQSAISSLRTEEYAAVVLDQFLVETEPDECNLMLSHLASAVPVYVNCGISGAERISREVRSALSRRQREEQAARRSAEQAIWSELNETVTAMLLSCDLALSTAGMSTAAAEKIHAVRDHAGHIRSLLEASQAKRQTAIQA